MPKKQVVEEPAIVAWGRSNIGDYKKQEFCDSLTRAFRDDGGADFIILDSNMSNQRFRAACVAWAIDNDLLYNDRNDDEGQQIVSSFRLTEEGKRQILGWP